MQAWADQLQRHWHGLHIGDPTVVRTDGEWRFSVPIFLGEVPPPSVRVQLFADAQGATPAEVVTLHQEQIIPGTLNGYVYAGEVTTSRPAQDYTVRIVPYHDRVNVPAEMPLIAWQS
jgi:starch phosphorylase